MPKKQPTDNSTSNRSGGRKRMVGEQTTKLMRNSTWLLLAKGVGAVLVVARSIILARCLGIEHYAAFSLVVAFVGPIQELLNANVGATLIKFGAELRQEDDPGKLLALIKLAYLTNAVLYIAIVLVTAVFIVAVYGVFFSIGGLHPFVVLFAAASGLTLFDTSAKSLLRLFDRFRLNSIVDIAASILGFAIVVLGALRFGDQIEWMIVTVSLTILLSSLAINGAALYELRRHVRGLWSASLQAIRDRWTELWRFSIGNSLSVSFTRVTARFDLLVLGAIASPSAVAIYDVSRKIAGSLLLIRDPIAMAVFPQIASLVAKRQYGELRNVIKDVYKLLTVPAILMLLLFCAFDSKIVSLWGSDFDNVGWTPRLMLTQSLCMLLTFWTTSMLLSLGQVRLRLIVTILGTCIAFCMALLVVPHLGADGMAFSMLIGTLLIQGVFVVTGLRPLMLAQGAAS